MILLDTHIWIWWLLNTGPLTAAYRKALDRKAAVAALSISWVSIWEMEMLERKERITLNIPFEQWLAQATNPAFISVLYPDKETVLAQRNLPESFHGDPADRLITATAMVHSMPLATFDRRIESSGAVEIWL